MDPYGLKVTWFNKKKSRIGDADSRRVTYTHHRSLSAAITKQIKSSNDQVSQEENLQKSILDRKKKCC